MPALKATAPLLANPVNRARTVALDFEQFRYGFADALSKDEARQVYDEYHVGRSTVPYPGCIRKRQPAKRCRCRQEVPVRGPMLLISGELDHQVPPAVVHAAYSRQGMNPGLTRFLEIKDRGHSLTIDSGWRDVAQISLEFIRRSSRPEQSLGHRNEGDLVQVTKVRRLVVACRSMPGERLEVVASGSCRRGRRVSGTGGPRDRACRGLGWPEGRRIAGLVVSSRTRTWGGMASRLRWACGTRPACPWRADVTPQQSDSASMIMSPRPLSLMTRVATPACRVALLQGSQDGRPPVQDADFDHAVSYREGEG